MEQVPPLLVRLCAKHPTKPRWTLSDLEISERSGLPISEVKRLCWMLDWDDVTVGQMKRFLIGCNIELFDHRAFWNTISSRMSGKLSHLTAHPEYLTELKPLIQHYARSKDSKTK